MNDPMCHDLAWPPVPTKIPSDIPKFKGKSGEDPGDHVTTFHLWCSSNSLNDDSCSFETVSMHPYGGCCEMVHRVTRGHIPNFQ
jgi:hypothetical protein